ncbi:MAG: hypothetical protein EBV08_08200, partial [Synechococcaceae bacterium WB6_1B_055]|nr:hypothetical protein [Synechococcaceae bacterium WB6_1B_055]
NRIISIARCICLDRYDNLFNQLGLLIVGLSTPVVDLATQLFANYGLRTPDALQFACCMQLCLNAW